jgi:AcrR family transcriptional regulator
MQRRQPAAAKTQPSAGEDRPARERLLAVAGELFYRQGIRSVGVDEIIAAADVAKMSLYRSFASKDALIAAYLREQDARSCARRGRR